MDVSDAILRRPIRSYSVPNQVGFLIIIVLVTVVITLAEVYGLQDQAATASWPTTTGTISQSNLSSGSAYGTRSHPVIIYSYFINGVQHQARRVDAGFWRFSQRMLRSNRSVVDAYPFGSSVTVHYNPANPDAAVLEAGISTRDWLESLGLMSVLWLTTLLTLWGIIRTNRRIGLAEPIQAI